MAENIATLGIRVDPRGAVTGASKAKRAILGIGKAADRIKRSIFSLQTGMLALGAGAVARGFIRTASSLEKLKVQLKTVTGSTVKANVAFNQLVRFTTKTPYEIEEVTSAFVKLKAYGLDPSEEALTSFGNTASAMGKDLNQMIEAVADAATMEFERLKEFGIKSKQEGDKVMFTFQGVTTEVQKDSEAIQAYLMNIGNTKFGGAMADQMNTLQGALSNLKGSWTIFQDQVMDAGVFDLIKVSLDHISETLFGDQKSVAANAKKAGEEISTFFREALFGAAAFVDVLSPIVRTIGSSIKDLWEGFRSLPEWVQQAGIVGAFILGKKGTLIIATTAALVDGLAKKLEEIVSLGTLGDLGIGTTDDKLNLPSLPEPPTRTPDVNEGEALGWAIELIRKLEEQAEARRKLLELQNGQNEAQEENNNQMVVANEGLTAFHEKWAEMAETIRTPMEEIGIMTAEIFGEGGTLATGIGNATAKALVFGKSFSASMKSLGQTIISSVIGNLVQMGVQMAINWAKEKLFKIAATTLDTTTQATKTATAIMALGTVTTASAAMGGVTAAAWAPAAAMVSLATFGANAAPAMAGITATNALSVGLGAASGLSGGLSFAAEGGDFNAGQSIIVGEEGAELFIPKTAGTVVPNDQLGGGGQTTNEVNIDFTVNAMDSQSFQQSMAENADLIVGVIRNAFHEQGEAVVI